MKYEIVKIINISSIFTLLLYYLTEMFYSSESTSDRYYMALYKKMLDPALKSSSKQAMFLNLLFKSMKKDISDRRLQVGHSQ